MMNVLQIYKNDHFLHLWVQIQKSSGEFEILSVVIFLDIEINLWSLLTHDTLVEWPSLPGRVFVRRFLPFHIFTNVSRQAQLLAEHSCEMSFWTSPVSWSCQTGTDSLSSIPWKECRSFLTRYQAGPATYSCSTQFISAQRPLSSIYDLGRLSRSSFDVRVKDL